MNNILNTFKNQLSSRPVLFLVAAAGVGLIYNSLRRQAPQKFAEANERLHQLLAEEDSQTRPFPKEIDLEPAFE